MLASLRCLEAAGDGPVWFPDVLIFLSTTSETMQNAKSWWAQVLHLEQAGNIRVALSARIPHDDKPELRSDRETCARFRNFFLSVFRRRMTR